jgi:hypothetical protein
MGTRGDDKFFKPKLVTVLENQPLPFDIHTGDLALEGYLKAVLLVKVFWIDLDAILAVLPREKTL